MKCVVRRAQVQHKMTVKFEKFELIRYKLVEENNLTIC